MGEIIKHDEEQTPIKVSLDSVPVVRQSNIEISDLHVAESPTTAMYEVRPFMFDAVNIAKVRVNEPLKIVNIAVDLDLSNNKGATKEMWVMGMIQGAFSKPTHNTDDYLPNQVIAEYVRSLGYDGIRFNS